MPVGLTYTSLAPSLSQHLTMADAAAPNEHEEGETGTHLVRRAGVVARRLHRHLNGLVITRPRHLRHQVHADGKLHVARRLARGAVENLSHLLDVRLDLLALV